MSSPSFYSVLPLDMDLHYPLDLKEPSQPPDLENRLANDHAQNKDVPPLDAAIRALGGVAVGALAHDDIRLLVLDLGEEVGEFLDCWWWILRC